MDMTTRTLVSMIVGLLCAVPALGQSPATRAVDERPLPLLARIGGAEAFLSDSAAAQSTVERGQAAGAGNQPGAAYTSVLFTNVRVFDGKSDALTGPFNVLVQDGKISKISAQPIQPGPDSDGKTRVIVGEGRVLMPGLIDAHWHTMMASIPLMVLMTADTSYIQLVAGKAAEGTLMRGFTSVRDLGGPAFGLKRAIDDGVLPGPRIYPSGAMICQTAGHGDFRQRSEVPRTPTTPLSHGETIGASAIADGVDEVTRVAREQLLLGACQLKLTGGGGVASPHGPLDTVQFTEAEIHAAVQAAENWGTYVAVHAYTPAAIRQAVAAGVKCIEHGQLMDEPTAALMAERGIWWSLQPFLDDEDAVQAPDAERQARFLQVTSGTEKAYALAKKYKIKTAFGSDILFDSRLAGRQGNQLAKLTRWYTPAECLRMATSVNAELLALSGPRNPYPGKLGVIEEGALADLILVDGDPIANIKLIENPGKNFLVIMKGGLIYKELRP